MDREGGATVFEFELGNLRFNAFWLTRVEVSMKKINSKKMISVKDDILNWALTLFLLFSAI